MEPCFMFSQQGSSYCSCDYSGNIFIYNDISKNDWVSIKSRRTGNGTSFVGTDDEVKRGFQKLYHTRIKHILLKNGADSLVWTSQLLVI